MVEKPIDKHFRSGATVLIKSFCDEINLVDSINRSVQWDAKQWKVSPGQHVLALVIDTLCGRHPLYRVKDFYEEQDTEVLFGAGVSANDFNNDVLGRTLDVLYQANPKKITNSITLNSQLTADEPLQFLHGDTTSQSFYGAYENKDEQGSAAPNLAQKTSTPNQPVQIVKGYNKDHRPDVKQIVTGLVVTGRGMPLFSNINDGNLNDKTWNNAMVETMAAALTPEQMRKAVYVADSAFFTEPNVTLARNRKLQFISLVSDNHALRAQAIDHVRNHLNMEVLGALSDQPNTSLYSVQEVSLPFHGEELRLIVVYSTHLFTKKQATFQHNLNKQREKLEKAAAELADAEFSCKQDAEAAWKKWLLKHKASLFPLVHKLISVTRPLKRAVRGRPKKEEEVKTETVYTLEIAIQAVPDKVIQEQESRLGYFVLATNVNDQTQLPAADVLKEYKQQSSVEMRFKFLKDPAFIDALFLKNPERVEALGYILIMALFIYMTLETRLRLTLEGKPIRLQVASGYYTNKPTGKQILLLLSRIVTVYWYNKDDQQWYRDLNYSDEVRKIFDLLEFDETVYLNVSPSYMRSG